MPDYKKFKIEYVVAVLVPLIFLCISWTILGINFETNDDTGIMMFVTGAKTGHPTGETVFCNILWGALLSFLYRLNESIPWYIIIYMILIWAVLFIVCNCCISFFKKPKMHIDNVNTRDSYSIVKGILVFCTFYFSIFLYYSVFFQFTTVAALCGLGAILLMILFPRGNKNIRISFFILLFFAQTIRPKCGYLTTAAFFTIYLFLISIGKNINRIYPLIIGFIQVATYAVNAIYERLNGWTEFREYHIARALWKDYPHIPFDKNPLLYEGQGWTKQLYELADRWFFMDRRVNAEAFEFFNTQNNTTLSFKWDLLRGFLNIPEIRMTIFIFSIISIGIIIYYIYKHKYRNLFFGIISFSLATILLLFFASKGRLPYRVSFSIIVLFMFPIIILLLQYIDDLNKIKCFLLCIATILIVIYSCFGKNGLMRITYSLSNDISRKEGIQTKKAVEQYAINHQNNIYIYDYSLAMTGSPFITYAKGKPYNLMFWGGSGMYSPPYYEQLAANGLKEFYSDQFFNKNVYFMGAKEPHSKLIKYLTDEFSKTVSVEIIYTEEKFIVYKFIK